jgi:undecaprenol kinase
MKSNPLLRRMRWALAGWRECWRSEGSFRTQVLCVSLGFVVLIVFRPAPVWWGLAAIMAALTLAAELFNSALERLADRLHPEQHPDIGAVKDMAAGAVFALALGGAAVLALAVASTLGG